MHARTFTSGIQFAFLRWLKFAPCPLHGFLRRYSLRSQLLESTRHELVDWIHGTMVLFRLICSRRRRRRRRRWFSTRLFVYLPMLFLTFCIMVRNTLTARTCFHFNIIAGLILSGWLTTEGTRFFRRRHCVLYGVRAACSQG